MSKLILAKPTTTNIAYLTHRISVHPRHFISTSTMALSSNDAKFAEIIARTTKLYEYMSNAQDKYINDAIKPALKAAADELIFLVFYQGWPMNILDHLTELCRLTLTLILLIMLLSRKKSPLVRARVTDMNPASPRH